MTPARFEAQKLLRGEALKPRGDEVAKARMFTIAPGVPFLKGLARAVLDDSFALGIEARHPLSLARTTVYLPTRRSASAFADAMADEIRRRTGQKAALLPRILPLGGLDEAEVDLLASGQNEAGADFPPAIAPLRRRMLLARQIEAWGRTVNRSILGLDAAHFRLVPERLGEAVGLAAHLAELIDTLHSSNVAFDALARLDVTQHDRLWEFTHGFLAIAGQWWPKILEAEGSLDPADRRNRLIDAECARIRAGRLEGPVIAAGSTGSVPATARLLSAIAQSPRGAVVLPGLDIWLDDASWATLNGAALSQGAKTGHDAAISHPQAVMARLVSGMGLERSAIVSLAEATPALQARARLVSEALRPAETTDLWQAAATHLTHETCADAMKDVTLVEADDEREEALAIALVLRRGLEDSGCQAALVTADRGLAERVAIELSRWNVIVDDSAGKALARSLHGHLARLVLDLVTGDFAPETLVALLAHPLLRLGLEPEERRRAACALELAVLRGSGHLPGLEGLRLGLAKAPAHVARHHAAAPLRRVNPQDLALAGVILERLEQALSPLLAIAQASQLDMAATASAHADSLGRLTEGADQPAAFAGMEGAALQALLAGVASSGAGLLEGDLTDYADMITGLMRDEVIAPRHQPEARITILGLLEARLLHADLMVLGGLNEGVWPPEASNDPFLNRSMRQELTLPVPERRIGQSAHDFSQGLASPRVVMTRAAKAGLAQTVPSRFWQRLQAVTPQGLWAEAQQRGNDVLALARHVSQPEKGVAAARPEPRPPVALVPTSYSVTEIETLYRDPYALYARRILRLDVLEPLAREMDARTRGTVLHDIVARFADSWRVALPADALGELMALGREAFAPLMQESGVAAFWWPRFEMLAMHYLEWEEERRPGIATLATETRSSLALTLADGTAVRLVAKADRVEQQHDGRVALVDFKTTNPGAGEIDRGLAAQLTIQAAMARLTGFGTLAAAPVASITYAELKPAPKGGLKMVTRSEEEHGLAAMADAHLAELCGLLMQYRTGERGFISRAMPKKTTSAGDYDHLARVKEWSRFAGSGEDDGEGGDR